MDIAQLCGVNHIAGALAKLYCAQQTDTQALSTWFEGVDFEALRPEVTCMAAAAAAGIGFDKVPEALIPRLRGIIKYVHTLNAGMTAGVCALTAALNKEGITPVLLDDTALHLCYPSTAQRHMWQMNIGVKPAEFSNLLSIARATGFQVETLPGAAVIRQGVTQQIFVIGVKENAYLRQNATRLKKGAGEFLCPQPAAILVGLLQRAFRALLRQNCRADILRWCMDMKHLLNQLSDADWQQAIQIARKEHAQAHIQLLLDIYCRLTVAPQPIRFTSRQATQKIENIVLAFRSCPEKGRPLRQTWLLCRLRRPDSLTATALLFGKALVKKLYSA